MKMKRKLLSMAVALLCSVGMWGDVTIDITSTRLTNANLSSLTGWTFDDSFAATGNDYTDYKTDGDANVVEFYSEWAATPGDMETAKNFKMVQTITLSAGTYQLTAFGFYREKGGDGTNTKAYLKAGSNTQYINGLSSSGVSAYSGTTDLYRAANAFSLGDFENTLEFTLQSTQSIEIGVVGTFNTQLSWCVLGPMTLVKVLEDDTELTDVIINPSFETGDKTGWTDDTTGDKMDVMNSDNLAGKDGTYWVERWWWDSTINIHQTTQELPAGYYTITARAKAESGNTISVYAKTGSNEAVTTSVGDADDYSVELYLNSADTIRLGLMGTHVSQTHIAVDNFRLTYLGNPYPALGTAITTAEGHTLGFESGEYAPYENVAALTALASANTINDAKTATYSEVVSATTTLTGATWTANAVRKNAIYDGDFSESAVGAYNTTNAVTGWDKVVGLREVVTSNVEGSPLYNKHGIYVWGSNTATYGNTTGYTLPLGANKIYRASYKRASQSGGSCRRANIDVKNSNNTSIATYTTAEDVKASDYNVVGSLISESVYFVTGNEADTYTLSLSPWGNGVFTDVELISVDALPYGENCVAGTYPNVTLSRTFKNDHWNTICLPFAVSASDIEGQFSEVKELSSITVNGENVSMKFADASAMTAGKPYLVKTEEDDVTTVTATNVAISASPTVSNTAVTDEGENYTVTYVGTFSGASLNAANNANAWVVSNSLLYNVNSNVSVGAYRGYFTVDAVEGEVKGLNLGFDDLETAIEAIDNGDSKMDSDAIYNLAGQRVQKATKGLYIINGKKVMVK